MARPTVSMRTLIGWGLSALVLLAATLWSGRPACAGDDRYNADPAMGSPTITSPGAGEQDRIWGVESLHTVSCTMVTDTDTCKDDPEETTDDSVSQWWTATAGTFPWGKIGTTLPYDAPSQYGSVDIKAYADDDYAPENNDYVAQDSQTSAIVTVYIVAIEIEINDTSAENDDVVQIKNERPANRFYVPCRAKVLGEPPVEAVGVTLENPDGRLRFPESADTETDIFLPGWGGWASFSISGESGSQAVNDAIIEATLTQNGDELGEEDATVFWFDQASITLTPVGTYSIVGNLYSTHATGHACTFSATARIRPAGMDCTVAQISPLRVGIMQQSNSYSESTTWDTPGVAWEAATPQGTQLTVPTEMTEETTYSHCVPLPVPDSEESVEPLYDMPGQTGTLDPNSLQPPVGCPDGGNPATSWDTPEQGAPPSFSKNYYDSGTKIATVTWSNRVSADRDEEFTTFCVIYNQTTEIYCALRQADWSLHISSGAGGANQATAGGDAAASEDPATGTPANDVEHVTNEVEGANTQTFTKPN